ncbi:MAG: hypothetical protein GY698_18985 [Actinomycetia bacterium]|nr:hypothetical protein [Actinomycetes bacterium]
MLAKLVDSSRLIRSVLSEEQVRTATRLGWLSIMVLVGLTVTGVWQFFAHAPVPSWYAYSPGSGFFPQPPPSTGVAALHGFFGGASVVLALFGGGWFAYKAVHRVPHLAVLVLVVGLVSTFTGSLIRFNLIKLAGQSFDAAGPGYAQIFTGDIDYVVTDRREIGAMGIRLWTLAHLVSVPVMLVAAWFSITRIRNLEEFTSSRPRKPELGPPGVAGPMGAGPPRR